MGKVIIHKNGFVCYVISFTALGSKTSKVVRNSPLEVKDKGQHCLSSYDERINHFPQSGTNTFPNLKIF